MAFLLAMLLAAVTSTSSLAQAQVFRWIDSNGTLHLTDNADSVPEEKRAGIKVYTSKKRETEAVPPEEDRSQARFATRVAVELGLQTKPDRDPLSVLNAYGIYPKAGWAPSARIGRRAVEEVAIAAETAARSRRLGESSDDAREAVARAARSVGVELPAPEPTPLPRPEKTLPQPLVVNPEVVVNTPPPVIIEAPQPLLSNPVFFFGVPFAPTRIAAVSRPSRAERVAHIFETARPARLAPFRQRVRREGFNTLAPPRLESMFGK